MLFTTIIMQVISFCNWYYLLLYDEGVFVEKFDSLNTSENRYTANNVTYIEGNKITFDYYYQDKNGKKYKFEDVVNAGDLDYSEREKSWFFVDYNKKTENTIDGVKLTVKYGMQRFIKRNPDYNQTVIKYEYPQVNGMQEFSSSTGIIENEKNVWVHPPREKFFKILEINPFPFIQAPYKIGNKWKWELEIGSFWGDKRWEVWEGSIVNKYNYEITDIKNIETKIGKLKCYEIKSVAESLIGKTYLTAYFNFEIGFVRLDYTNIDSTKTVLEIIKFEKENHVE